MTVGELFAGIGGLSLGLERAGFEVCWQVECDDYATTILERHWPHVPRRRDVRLADASNLAPVDCIAGGFPCQDISVAGQGAGLAGGRSGLWREFARIVRELRPRWVIAENVPALRTRGADVVLADLEAAGYTCWPVVVGARHVGAPHRRDRVFIVGRAEGVAHGHGHGREGERCSGLRHDERATRRHDVDGRCERAMGDADPRRRGASIGHVHAGQRQPDARGASSGDMGDAECVRDGATTGSAGCTDEAAREIGEAGTRGVGDTGPAWPAGPGQPQREWEAPRTIESGLGRAAHGISARLAARRRRNELKALGNAVVPQVAELIGRAVLTVDAALEREAACGT